MLKFYFLYKEWVVKICILRIYMRYLQTENINNKAINF